MKKLLKNLWNNLDIYVPIYFGLEILTNLVWVWKGNESFIGTVDFVFYGTAFVLIGLVEWSRKEKSE